MAFDWNQLEGYKEDMTPEEKIALLENYDPPAPKNDPAPTPNPAPNPDPTPAPKGGATVSKAQFDKVASELAAVKKQLRGKMTEDEQKEYERSLGRTPSGR